MKHKIQQYKGVNIFYHEDDGMIHFESEGRDRETKYVFEAKKVIDNPIWEDCNLEGYFVDGYIDKYIGLARATKKDIKSGRPLWEFKGQYDLEYRTKNELHKVFLKSKHNDEIYSNWKEQRDVYHQELRKLNQVADSLK